MSWTDLFNPDKIIVAAFKTFVWILALTFAFCLLLSALSRLSGLDVVLVLIIGVILNWLLFFRE